MATNSHSRPKVVSIVLTWNSAEFITDAIDSLLNSNYPTDILIIDNDSADNTREIIANTYPDIRLVNSGDNLGYAGGNNFGMHIAQEVSPDYLFILNPDASVSPDCIGTLVDRMERTSTLAGVSPLIFFHNSNTKLWFGGSSMKWRTGERIQIPTEYRPDAYVADGSTDFLSGCAMLVRGDAITKVGMMDDRYFLYCEETDWSMRFAKAGYGIGLQADAQAWHRASASTGGFFSPLYQYYINRNRLLLISKHRKRLLPIVLFSSFYMNFFRLLTIFKQKGAKSASICAAAILKAYADFALRRFGRRTIPR